MMAADIWLSMNKHRLSFAVAVFIGANHRPVIDPLHRLQMSDPAIGAAILKVNEPGLAGRQLNPASLMRAIDVGLSLVQHDPIFIRPENIF